MPSHPTPGKHVGRPHKNPGLPKAMSSFAASRLRWNNLNGSGPVNTSAFLAAHATDSVHSHDWVFGRKQSVL
jgi:hypothetical protein